MKITNKYNLPQALLNIANKDKDKPHNAKNTFSATTLKKGVKEIVLELRHFDEITMDISDMVWTIFGTAVHSLAENGSDDRDGESEIYFEWEVPVNSKLGKTYKLTGRCDLFNKVIGKLQDYKTATTWKFIYKDFSDWESQGNIYTFLIRKNGYDVKQDIEFHALLKDWSQGDLDRAKKKGEYYPEHSIITYKFSPLPQNEMESFEKSIVSKIQQIVDIIENDVPDDEIPFCSFDERWATMPKYAVKKKGNVRALKVCSSEKEANEYIESYGFKDKDKLCVEYREGEDKKCQNYCPCHEFCDYYLNKYRKEKNENE